MESVRPNNDEIRQNRQQEIQEVEERLRRYYEERNSPQQLEREAEQQRARQNHQQEVQEVEERLRRFYEEQNAQQYQQDIEPFRQQQIQRGLTPDRIGMFQQFDADESMFDEQCIVCMNDLEIGTKMVRLDCHVSHYLCKVCAYRWFKDHNTCPICRHVFFN